MLANYHEAFTLPINGLISYYVQSVFSKMVVFSTIHAYNAATVFGVSTPLNFACKFGTFIALIAPTPYLLDNIAWVALNNLDMILPKDQYLASKLIIWSSVLCISFSLGKVFVSRIDKLLENEEGKKKLVAFGAALKASIVFGLLTVAQKKLTWDY